MQISDVGSPGRICKPCSNFDYIRNIRSWHVCGWLHETNRITIKYHAVVERSKGIWIDNYISTFYLEYMKFCLKFMSATYETEKVQVHVYCMTIYSQQSHIIINGFLGLLLCGHKELKFRK